MKKILFLLVGACVAVPMAQAENKIRMVTYFPVPYVAYSKVQVDKVLDVGLTKTCDMSLGCTESGNAGLRPLSVTDAYLKAGRLDLNRAAAIKSTSVTLGTGSGEPKVDFKNSLRIGTLNDGYSLESDQMTLDILKLFPDRISNDFPSCAATGAAGAPQVSWQKLQIKDKEETFLVCGTPKEGEPVLDCSDRSYKLAHKSECCPNASLSDTDCWNCNNSLKIYETLPQRQSICIRGCTSGQELLMRWYASSGSGISGVTSPESACYGTDYDNYQSYIDLCNKKNIVAGAECTEDPGKPLCVIPKNGANPYTESGSKDFIYTSGICSDNMVQISFDVMQCKEYTSCTENGW